MIANYHTHTYRCRHAQGGEEEYVAQAYTQGLKILGMSDHTPHFFPGDYYSHMRMYPQELEGYCNNIRKLKTEYEGRLDIHLGVEAEFYPDLMPALLSALRDNGVEYMIQGQHWSGNEMGEPYNGRATEDAAILDKFCRQTVEGMETGYFTYLAHPDLIFFTGDDHTYLSHMERICQAAVRLDMPLEINLLGIRSGRNYPDVRFWKMAGEYGCKVVLGSDAHLPADVTDPMSEAKALALIEKCGLTLLETVPLIRF